MFTKFSEIKQCNGHYAILGHRFFFFGTNWKLIYDFLSYLLFCTVSKLWLIIGQMFASKSGVPHFNTLAGGNVDPLPISP